VNLEKSILSGGQKIDYLGYTIDTSGEWPVIKAHKQRVSRIKRNIKTLLKKGSATARVFAKVAGLSVPVAWTVAPGRLFLRHLYHLLATRSSWSDTLYIDEYTRDELIWWLEAIDQFNFKEIKPQPVQVQLTTDASKTSWGAKLGVHEARGDWNNRVSCQSSNYREILAIFLALLAFRKQLHGLHVQILTDNVTAMAYVINKGGPILELSHIARAIWAVWNLSRLQTYCRQGKFGSGQAQQVARSTQLDVASRLVSTSGTQVGSSYSRPICEFRECSASTVQFPLLGSNVGRDRCSRTKLGTREQLHKSTLGFDVESIGQNRSGQSSGYYYRAGVAKSTVVPKTVGYANRQSSSSTETPTDHVFYGTQSGTIQEQRLERSRVAGFWRQSMTCEGWSERAIEQSMCALADSTKQSYDNVLLKCELFCKGRGVEFPPNRTNILADFLCELSDSSNRPSSLLHTASAALSHVYSSLYMEDITKDVKISRLMSALVKSGTVMPMKKSSVLPVEKFSSLFLTWGDNTELSIKCLRLKTLTLLAIALMLRPSDVAPKAKQFDVDDFSAQSVKFTKDMLLFSSQGVTVTFFGIKNDVARPGFQVFLPRHDNVVLDPVAALPCRQRQ
jgi:hypothetical protein